MNIHHEKARQMQDAMSHKINAIISDAIGKVTGESRPNPYDYLPRMTKIECSGIGGIQRIYLDNKLILRFRMIAHDDKITLNYWFGNEDKKESM